MIRSRNTYGKPRKSFWSACGLKSEGCFQGEQRQSFPWKPDSDSQFYGLRKIVLCKVMGQHIEIGSDWPFAEEHVKGNNPFRMTWLTQVEGVNGYLSSLVVGLRLFRMAPMTHDTAWIHPGFLKYTFLERGVRKGREQAATMLALEFLIPMIATRDILL